MNQTWQHHLQAAFDAAHSEERLLRSDSEIHAEATDSGFAGFHAALSLLTPRVSYLAYHKCEPDAQDLCTICGADCRE